MKVKLLSCTTLGMVMGLAFSSAHADVIFTDKFEQYSLEGFGTPQGGWALTNAVIRSGNYAAVYTMPPITKPTTAVKPQPTSEVGLLTAARNKYKHSKHRHKHGKHAIRNVPNGGGGGQYSVGGNGRQRSEGRVKGTLQRGRNYTIQFSNKVSNPNTGSIVFNVHKNRAPGDPTGKQPIELHTRNGNWVVSVYSNSARGKQFNLGPIDKSKYTDWKFSFKLSSGNDGRLQVFKNGKQVLNYSGPNDFRGKGDPYVKFGAYRPTKALGSGGQTAYYDQVRISSN